MGTRTQCIKYFTMNVNELDLFGETADFLSQVDNNDKRIYHALNILH